MPFAAAIAVLNRKAGLNEFQLSRIQSEEVGRVMRQVESVTDPELEKTFPKR